MDSLTEGRMERQTAGFGELKNVVGWISTENTGPNTRFSEFSAFDFKIFFTPS